MVGMTLGTWREISKRADELVARIKQLSQEKAALLKRVTDRARLVDRFGRVIITEEEKPHDPS